MNLEFNSMTGLPLGSYRTVLSSHEIDFDKSLLAGGMDTRDHEAYKDLARPDGDRYVYNDPALSYCGHYYIPCDVADD